MKLNATREILEFSQIGGPVPNRGSQGQEDINIFGLAYLQRISDAVTNGALHIEPGLWLYVPATKVPTQGPTVVRQGSIPHGTSVMAIGKEIAPIDGPPTFKPADSTPVLNPPGPPLDARYLASFANPPLPPYIESGFVKNPNLALQEELNRQKINGNEIVNTVVLSVSTTNSGGTLNIPFVTKNANVTSMDSIF